MKHEKIIVKLTTIAILCLEIFITSPSFAGNSGVLSAGYNYVCGLKTNGKVVCWGGAGCISAPTPPSDTFTQLSSGSSHTCGLKTDGNISCWGDNNKGQSSPPPGAYIQVSAGNDHSCALKDDGTVICWGDNSDDEISPPSGVFIQVAAGNNYTCGLRDDNSVECWGKESEVITKIPQETFTSIVSGNSLVCGLKTDGVGKCWGSTNLNLGFLSQLDVSGYDKACGLKADKGINCWNLSFDDMPSSTFFSYIAVGSGGFACALKENGRVLCWKGDKWAPFCISPPEDVTFKQPSIPPIPIPQAIGGTCTKTELKASYQEGYQAGLSAAAPSDKTHATYDSSGIHIPFLDVADSSGKIKTYDIHLIQRSSGFTFDLDMNKIKLR